MVAFLMSLLLNSEISDVERSFLGRVAIGLNTRQKLLGFYSSSTFDRIKKSCLASGLLVEAGGVLSLVSEAPVCGFPFVGTQEINDHDLLDQDSLSGIKEKDLKTEIKASYAHTPACEEAPKVGEAVPEVGTRFDALAADVIALIGSDAEGALAPEIAAIVAGFERQFLGGKKHDDGKPFDPANARHIPEMARHAAILTLLAREERKTDAERARGYWRTVLLGKIAERQWERPDWKVLRYLKRLEAKQRIAVTRESLDAKEAAKYDREALRRTQERMDREREERDRAIYANEKAWAW